MPNCVKLLALALLLALPGPALSAHAPDSLAQAPFRAEQFRWGGIVVPGLLLTGGALGVDNAWYEAKLKEPARDFAAGLRGDNYLHFDNYIQYIPSAAYLGLGFATKTGHNFQERALTACTAWALTAVLVLPVKYFVDEVRPDGSAANSFPSGHTATAFVGAELVRLEYGPWWGAGAYAVAATTAVMRVYNNRHWVNDLLGGAAMGILSANVAYWLLPWERRLFGLDAQTPSVVTFPYNDGRSAGLALTLTF